MKDHRGNKQNEFLNREWSENVNRLVRRLTNKRRRRMDNKEKVNQFSE